MHETFDVGNFVPNNVFNKEDLPTDVRPIKIVFFPLTLLGN